MDRKCKCDKYCVLTTCISAQSTPSGSPFASPLRTGYPGTPAISSKEHACSDFPGIPAIAARPPPPIRGETVGAGAHHTNQKHDTHRPLHLNFLNVKPCIRYCRRLRQRKLSTPVIFAFQHPAPGQHHASQRQWKTQSQGRSSRCISIRGKP